MVWYSIVGFNIPLDTLHANHLAATIKTNITTTKTTQKT